MVHKMNMQPDTSPLIRLLMYIYGCKQAEHLSAPEFLKYLTAAVVTANHISL